MALATDIPFVSPKCESEILDNICFTAAVSLIKELADKRNVTTAIAGSGIKDEDYVYCIHEQALLVATNSDVVQAIKSMKYYAEFLKSDYFPTSYSDAQDKICEIKSLFKPLANLVCDNNVKRIRRGSIWQVYQSCFNSIHITNDELRDIEQRLEASTDVEDEEMLTIFRSLNYMSLINSVQEVKRLWRPQMDMHLLTIQIRLNILRPSTWRIRNV